MRATILNIVHSALEELVKLSKMLTSFMQFLRYYFHIFIFYFHIITIGLSPIKQFLFFLTTISLTQTNVWAYQ